ncbi:DeoR/GlpR family DNA-binding transcription regulator [Paenibacillus sp. B2(2019)]|uniref:DeoR/GlpR family DNA-binding transcription regulator n=1 Tax=Paenibacillus sp. B2(2019) TaxID=2607754 RepID=UPI0011F1F3FD|nr:DeoR/GlpR family DNA-binding transcription regulator [Paenibacillus sp. B2(2019)]KAA1191608.1 DeoR/GlpR transcriptional regulator [Paenibacillus sp. B2(2019)]
MLKADRQAYILKKVETEGRVVVQELTQELNVTEDTIRKDLQSLSKLGLLKRIHGGAHSLISDMKDFNSRVEFNSQTKADLAKRACRLIENAKVIFIDGGSTNLKVAENIPEHFDGRIITNSPSIALSLCRLSKASVTLLGGDLDKKNQVLFGASTLRAIQQIHLDLTILGVSTLDSKVGITVPSYEESIIKNQLFEQSSMVIAIATKEKLEKISTFFVAKVSALDYLITEGTVDNKIVDTYKKLGVNVVTV